MSFVAIGASDVSEQPLEEIAPSQTLVNSKIIRPLRIALMQDNPPYSLVLPNGKPAGLYVDIWKEWSKVTGIKIEFIQENLLVNISDLKDGRADFHAGLFINDKRKQWADFSIAVDRIETGLFYRGDDLEKPSLEELAGKNVSAGKGSFQEDFLKKNYPKIRIYPSKYPQITIKKLLNGELDAMIGEIPFIRAQMAKMGINGVLSRYKEAIFSNTVHALVPHHNKHLIPIINDGIKKLPINRMIEIENRWLFGYPSYFKALSTTQFDGLTLEEQQWLDNHPRLILGIDNNWEPFEFVDQNGNYAGITSEYVALIEKALSIELIPEKGNSWAQVIEKSKRKELDLLPGVVASEERESFLVFTKPYSSFPDVVVSRKDSKPVRNMDDLAGMKIATVEGFNVEALLRENHPNIDVVSVTNIEEGIKLVENKTVYGFVDNIAVMTHFINVNNRNDLMVALYTPYSDHLSFGVRKGLEPLVPILNKVLESISKKEKTEILNRWLSVQVNVGFDFMTIARWGVPSFLILMFVILFVTRTNAKLQKQIALRNKTEISLTLARKEAEKAQAVAENANLSKNQFLANMSHEIRTPMNAIIGTSYLLSETNTNKEQKDLVDILDTSAKSLLRLINDILDLSKVEAGKVELEERKFELPMVLRNVIKQIEINLNFSNEKNSDEDVEMTYQIDPAVPTFMIGDRLRLSQIVTNLLSNAVKFTHSGSIKTSVVVENIKGDSIVLHFIIADTGIGMTDEQMEKLFKTYSQADSSTSRKYGGTGLGLSICKNLCELMQGNIWVESVLGEGTQFHFTCRFGFIEDSKNIDASISKINRPIPFSHKLENIDELLSDKKILVVDDNQVNLIIVKKMLESKSIRTEVVTSGEEAISRIEKEHFDCILMDVQMPGLDGYQTTKLIREGNVMKNIPIIGLSANAMEEDIRRGRDAGMNDYQSKPINPKSLFKSIAKQLTALIQ